jgi:TctA family transporter
VGRKIADTFWLRLGATGYYGIVCILALDRFGATALGRAVTDHLTPLQLAIFVFLAFTSWCLLASLSRREDRIAAVLYGVFYSGRIGIHFLHGRNSTFLQGLECAITITGLLALAPGLIQSFSNHRVHRSSADGPLSPQ